MKWRDAVAPVRMRRVAIVAPDYALRPVLVRLAGAVEISVPDDVTAPPEGPSGAAEPAALTAAPPDLAAAQAGRPARPAGRRAATGGVRRSRGPAVRGRGSDRLDTGGAAGPGLAWSRRGRGCPGAAAPPAERRPAHAAGGTGPVAAGPDLRHSSVPWPGPESAEGTVDHHASQRWAALEEVTIRWRGSYGYLSEDDDDTIELCRIQYLGDPDHWAFAIWQASTDSYAESVLLDGRPAGHSNLALDTVCTLYLAGTSDTWCNRINPSRTYAVLH
jgi:hypothetical protein